MLAPPIGAAGKNERAPDPQPFQNRPTFQQAVSITRGVPR
jgi:hypothetical protein